ncbi:hypothetical protein [Streptomyces sp. NPDC047706]|uniref:NACHT N-terminal Helical domain 1-containing protein n=1 Tax=Streptomyces sp. NPDC047706 TaxID=3365486 RepID=UPI003717FD77
MTDVQAVEFGHEALAGRLHAASGMPDRALFLDAAHFYLGTLTTACLHILHFFTRRSTFVPAPWSSSPAVSASRWTRSTRCSPAPHPRPTTPSNSAV